MTVPNDCDCLNETRRNLLKLESEAAEVWSNLVRPTLEIVPDALSLDKALVFPKTKDRPVVISAMAAQAQVLLTLDRVDFYRVLGSQVYGMAVQTPAEFLLGQRNSGAI